MLLYSETTASHVAKRAEIQRQVRLAAKEKKHIKINHGATNSTRLQSAEGKQVIDITQLREIIEINSAERYAIVEPNVSMDQLFDALQPYNLVAPVITEFPGITIGGAILGGAGESSSFRYGCVSESCLEYEIVLGDGRCITASPNTHQDLFYGLASTYGTLGVLTLIKLALIPSKPFVSVRYERIGNFEEAVTKFNELVSTPIDFLDGIMFAKDRGVIMNGIFTDDPGLQPVKTYHRAVDEWFSITAETYTNHQPSYQSVIPLRDYLFRYDRGAFWAGRLGFPILHVPYSRLFRIMFAWCFKTRKLYSFLHTSQLAADYFVQDVCVPEQKLVEFLNVIDQELQVYPLWLCPLKSTQQELFSPTHSTAQQLINVGIYGDLGIRGRELIAKHELLELTAKKLKARKVLYAHSYYSEETFWSIYPLKQYNRLRELYHAEDVFPSMHLKMRGTVAPRPSILRGWLGFIRK